MLINVFLSAALGETRQRVRICTLTHYAWRYIWFLTGEQWVFQECDLRIIYNSSSRDPAPMYKNRMRKSSTSWLEFQVIQSTLRIFFWGKKKQYDNRKVLHVSDYPPGNQHIPSQITFEDDFPFPKVGYVIVSWRAPSLKLAGLVQTILRIVGFREGICFILPPRSLTARPWKMMVGRRSFPRKGSHVTTSGGYGILTGYIFYLGGVPPPALWKPCCWGDGVVAAFPTERKHDISSGTWERWLGLRLGLVGVGFSFFFLSFLSWFDSTNWINFACFSINQGPIALFWILNDDVHGRILS